MAKRVKRAFIGWRSDALYHVRDYAVSGAKAMADVGARVRVRRVYRLPPTPRKPSRGMVTVGFVLESRCSADRDRYATRRAAMNVLCASEYNLKWLRLIRIVRKVVR